MPPKFVQVQLACNQMLTPMSRKEPGLHDVLVAAGPAIWHHLSSSWQMNGSCPDSSRACLRLTCRSVKQVVDHTLITLVTNLTLGHETPHHRQPLRLQAGPTQASEVPCAEQQCQQPTRQHESHSKKPECHQQHIQQPQKGQHEPYQQKNLQLALNHGQAGPQQQSHQPSHQQSRQQSHQHLEPLSGRHLQQLHHMLTRFRSLVSAHLVLAGPHGASQLLQLLQQEPSCWAASVKQMGVSVSRASCMPG